MTQAVLDLAGGGGADRLRSWDPADAIVAPGWTAVVRWYFESAAGQALSAFLRQRLAAGAVVYPPQPLRALAQTAPDAVRAVVLGQDPYHGPGQAEGLAFSVAPGVRPPPSLRNILTELGCDRRAGGSLLGWAQRGVLLLNTCLTVEDGQAGSHARKGWEGFTDAVLVHVAAQASPCVYLLWGAHAQAKSELIQGTARAHGRDVLVLQANHPSPLSARRGPQPFLGCGHFQQARAWLDARGVPDPFVCPGG